MYLSGGVARPQPSAVSFLSDITVTYRPHAAGFTKCCKIAVFRKNFRLGVGRSRLNWSEDAEYNSRRPLLGWLDYNGFAVTAKPAKEFDDGEDRRKLKRNIGVELVVDALCKVCRPHSNDAAHACARADHRSADPARDCGEITVSG